MVELLLHAGTHKTGTTLLQQMLAEAQAELLGQGLLYPVPVCKRHPKQHAELAILISEGDLEGASRIASRIRDLHQAGGASRIFLSGESISMLEQAELTALRDLLERELGPQVKFTPYLMFRNSYEFVRSTFNQHLRYHRFAVTEGRFIQHLKDYHPDRIARAFTAVFGRDAVKFVSYDKHRHDLLGFWMTELGVTLPPEVLEKEYADNRSLEFWVANLVNTLCVGWDPPDVKRLVRELSERLPPAGGLSDPYERSVLDRVLGKVDLTSRCEELAPMRDLLNARPGEGSAAQEVDTGAAAAQAAERLRVIEAVFEELAQRQARRKQQRRG